MAANSSERSMFLKDHPWRAQVIGHHPANPCRGANAATQVVVNQDIPLQF